jgi:hypothetical protein
VDEDEARRAGQTPDDYAQAQAARWQQGLAEWGQDGTRIERLRRAADFAIYTPGSRAGLPVSIVSSFAAPPAAVRDDPEAMAERAGSTATSLWSLAGVDAPPRSREHTLLASLFTTAWQQNRDLDLPGIIQSLQTPPFQKVGVLDLESFFPARERFELAMRLNGLLAAPGFEHWLQGTPLDPASILHTAEGKPRVAIFSIAHLGDAERMFFVSLLLNQIVAWMRGQTGTSSLRAIVYMDEIMGYFPPVANPPSKGPLLTLLKQGRAFGVGVVLATQNPVDLDYKGLANTGTWFLGRLQTERDKARVLDGLEGAAAGSLDRTEADRILSALGKRVFLLHDVHESAPVVFQTRWALSYLRGPLSRDQIRTLMAAHPLASRASTPGAESVGPAQPTRGSARVSDVAAQPARTGGTSNEPPIVPPGLRQFFLPAPQGSAVTYRPVILGAARVGFADTRLGVDELRDVLLAAPISSGAVPVDWAQAERLDLGPDDLSASPHPDAAFDEVPAAALAPRSYAGWEKSFARWVSQNERLELRRHRTLKLTSRPGESERDFRIRVQEAQRVARDEAVDAMRQKYATRQAQLAEQLRRAESAVGREQEQASHQKLQTAVSMGATLLGALLGRKAISTGTLGRATTAARGVGRSMKEQEDIRRATESVEAVRARQEQLNEQVEQDTRRIAAEFEGDSALEDVTLTPKRGQVTVQFVALGWRPSGAGGDRV